MRPTEVANGGYLRPPPVAGGWELAAQPRVSFSQHSVPTGGRPDGLARRAASALEARGEAIAAVGAPSWRGRLKDSFVY